jgi:serine/threonine protein kinase
MGVVYRAHDTLLERVVALKIISTSIEDNPELRERFFREARAAGQLSHRNIITIHDLGEHEGQPYLAMEFLSGEDLQHRLARQETMSLRRKLEIASEICEGLSYAHRRGLVHRDVKPANIFITDEGVVKLLDFGLARMVASELTRSNMMMGTLNYMAPEQVRGERTDHRADIFSFGVVLYEMLSGKKAFQGDSFATTLYKILQDVPEPLLSIDPTLPHEIAWLVEKTLAKPKDERYQDLTDVTRDLAIIRQHLSGSELITMAGSALSGPRMPSDPPSPRPGRPPSSGSRAVGSGVGSGSGARSGSGTGGSAVTGFPAERAPSDAQPAPRSRPAVIIGAVAVGAVAVAIAWVLLRPDAGSIPPQEPAASTVQSPPVVPPASAPPATAPSQQEPPKTAPAEEPAAPRGEDSIRAQARSADAARERMTRAKNAAREAGNAAMRSPAYVAAAAAEREGNRLYQRKQFVDATAKFYEASGLFRSAELTAPEAPPQAPGSQPSRADTKPESAPAQPPPAAPPIQAPPPGVPTGEGPVQLPPGSAPKLPPTPPPPKPAPPTAAEGTTSPVSFEKEIRELLMRYERAMEGRNLAALKDIWPSFGGAQQEAQRREFAFARRLEMDIDEPKITVSGNTGTAIFIRRYQILTTDSQKLDRLSRTTMSVRRVGNEWVIDRVQFEQIR